MSVDVVTERFFEALVSGDRPQARAIVNEQHAEGADPETLVIELYWPTYELIQKLHHQDQITRLSYNYATRLLRLIVDQTASALLRRAKPTPNGKTVFACCAGDEGGDLGAQMAVDLLEAGGFTVRFAGGNLSTDEVQSTVQQDRPDVLLMFCSGPQDLPDIRTVIDNLHEVGACPTTQIAVGGGVFNRVDTLLDEFGELAKEVGADIWANDPLEMVDLLTHEPQRRAGPDQRTVGKRRRTPAAKAA